MTNFTGGSRQLAYFKEKIKRELEKIRDDIGDVRYNLYVATVDQCDNYEDLREMAELEMQLDFIKYAKTSIKDRLQEKYVDIQDLRKVRYPPYDEESMEIEETDMEAELDSPETLAMLALAMHKRLESEPIEEQGKVFEPGKRIGMDVEVELSEEEQLELMAKEMEEDEEGLSAQYDGYIGDEEDNDFDESDEDGYFGSDDVVEEDGEDEEGFGYDEGYFIEDDAEENVDGSNSDEIDIEDSGEFFIDDESEGVGENDEDFDEEESNSDDFEDYFIEDSDEYTGDEENFEESEFGEDYFTEDDDGDNLIDNEEVDGEADFDISDGDDFFVESDDEDDTVGDDDIEIEDSDDFFVESDEEGTFIEDEEDSNEDDSYFDDEYFSSDDDDMSTEQKDGIDIDMDDYFADLEGSTQSASTAKKVEEKPRVITPDSVFNNEKVNGMFKLIHKSVQGASKVTNKAVEEASKRISSNSFFQLEIDEEDTNKK